MKKIFLSLMAVAALASCVKSNFELEETKSEIKLAPVAAKQTKANVFSAIDGTTYPTAENFDVYGYWKNVGAGEEYTDGDSYFGETAVEFVNKGNYWGGAKSYYWPKNGALRFAAYSPSSLDVAHSQDGDTFSISNYVQPSATDATFDFLVAPTSKSYTALTATENVSIVFEHALSWLTLQVKAKDAEAAGVFTIKSVTINKVNTTADFEASMLDGIQYEEWSNQGRPAAYEVFEGEQSVIAEAQAVENVTAGTLVIPQETTTVTVVFNQNGVNGTMDMEDQTVTLDLVLDEENSPWEPGFHYTYTLVFGLDEILINPSVADWKDVIVDEIEVESTSVYSVEQLEAALEKGGKIVLKNDLEAASLTVAKGVSVVLDLAGKTIAGSDETTKNYGLFQNNGALVIEDSVGGGKLTATATTNSNWDRYSAVISNNPGSTCTINGGTIEHLGGTDMSYAIDNLTNGGTGDVSCVINGGTIKSTYRAVRQFLNSDSKKNDLTINGGTIEGANKAVFFHDPSTKANKGKLIVKGGQLTGGVYLFVTAGSTKWPVEVSMKEECVDVVTSANVPAGYAVVLADGAYTVAEGATGVATVEALAAALAADQENISVILTADMDLTATEMHVAAGKKVEVDLGGKTVTVKAPDPIKNNGTMTLKNGKVVAENDVNSRRCVYNYGTMVIEDVEFVQTYDEKGAAINNAGIMTINNATVNATYYSVWAEGADSKTIINGGTFTTTNNLSKEFGYSYAIRVSEGKMIINDANVSGNHGAICALDGAFITLNSGTYTLATPCFTPGGNSSWVLYANDATVNYNEANCTLVKPDTKTNGYYTTEDNGVIKTF